MRRAFPSSTGCGSFSGSFLEYYAADISKSPSSSVKVCCSTAAMFCGGRSGGLVSRRRPCHVLSPVLHAKSSPGPHRSSGCPWGGRPGLWGMWRRHFLPALPVACRPPRRLPPSGNWQVCRAPGFLADTVRRMAGRPQEGRAGPRGEGS